MDWTVSDDAAGLILLGLTVVSLLAGTVLAFRGFASADKAARKAAEAAEDARHATELMRDRADAAAFAAPNARREVAEVARTASSIDTGVRDVKDALAELRGEFAPARVLFALSLLFFLAALIAFDVIALDLEAGETGTTTETTP